MPSVPTSPAAIAIRQTETAVNSAKAYIRERNKWGYMREDEFSRQTADKNLTGTDDEIVRKLFERPDTAKVVVGEDSVSKQRMYAVWMKDTEPTETDEPTFS